MDFNFRVPRVCSPFTHITNDRIEILILLVHV